MPWGARTVEEKREEFVLAVKRSTNFSALCREFGITRRTGYKWVRRAADGRIWIAGFPLSNADGADSAGADWIFSQPELVIRQGRVTWTDEMRKVPTLALSEVNWVLRNDNRSHAMRFDATPPQHWGERLSLMGVFKQPLLSRRASDWRVWQGQVYAMFTQIDLAQLRQYANLGVDLQQGAGSVRAWVDVSRGAVVALDVARRYGSRLTGLVVSGAVYVALTRSLDVSHELELIESHPELADPSSAEAIAETVTSEENSERE